MKYVLLVLATLQLQVGLSQFRVYPYLLSPSDQGIRITWFTEDFISGTLKIVALGQTDTMVYTSQPKEIKALRYSELEEAERSAFPDMFVNRNIKHSLEISGLVASTTYRYYVLQGVEKFSSSFHTAPQTGSRSDIHFIAFADSETDPAGRKIYRTWSTGSQHPESTGRPDSIQNYLLTETEGYQANLAEIKKAKPDFLILSGDIVQGGGYQRAWDEFFFHNAGKFDTLLSNIPFLPAIGNWENFGARNGGYTPEAIAAARAKYKAYFDVPPNNNPNYQNFYYRIDYGPLTLLTLDSSNGLPDSTDGDTNININADTYPANDLPDVNEGSDQWKWTVAQLQDAYEAKQIIFVQFHHIPYSSGGHSLPLTAFKSTGQAGIPMRAYQPMFKKYGVVAVLCGHNESLEHSVVEGVHYWDTGIAGDGFGYCIDDIDPRRKNPFRQFVAHRDAPEWWQGPQLVDGGKHYGYLDIQIAPQGTNYEVTMTPYYIFPITNEQGSVIDMEKRAYKYVVKEIWSY